MTEKDNQVDKPRWPPKRSHHDRPRTALQSHRTEIAPSAPQVEPFTQHASGKEGEEQDDTKRGEAYASSYNGGVSRGTPSLPMGTEANLPSAAETRVAAENAIHTDEGKKRAAGPANEDSRPRKRVKVETEAKDDGTSSTLGRRQADASTPIVISKSSPAPDSLPSSEGRRGPHHAPCRPMTRMTTRATAATSDGAKVVPHFHLSSDDRHPGKGSKRTRNADDDSAAAAAHPRKRQKLETENASTIPTAPPPALAQPPSSEPTLPIPTYLDVLVKLPRKGSRFLRLAETTSCIALSTLEQATHLHLRPFCQPEDGSPVKLEPKQYATILKCASNLSWLMLEDVVTTGTEDDLRRAMKKAAPKPLRVLSLALPGNAKRIDTRMLDTLLAPFSEVGHLHLNVSDARLEIPPRSRIRGWHIDGRCGFGFIGRVEEYIASGHPITTLNFMCEANDLDGRTLRAMKELVNRAAPTLTCLGISPDVVKGKDTELDDDFVAGLAFKKLTRLVLHLPFRESQLPNPPSSENPKVYPKTLERVKGSWDIATTLLQRLSDTTQTASRLKEVTVALHGEIPESDTRESVKAMWWGAQRNEFLRAFATSATTLLGTDSPLRGRTLCIDMSSLHFDAEFPLDYHQSSWFPPYLFPDIAARRVWLGPRPIPSLDIPQPIDGLRSSLILPVSAEEVSVERLDACIAVHHASGGEKMPWKTPDAVCPLWCAPLWWIVAGSGVLA